MTVQFRRATLLLLTATLVAFPLGAVQAATVRASTGARAEVAASHASNFQCLISGLEAEGYQIDFMGGYRRHGSVRGSLHPMGLALDINQTGRGRVTRMLPHNTTSLASSCGLFHGAVWRNQDQGHFQVGGYDPSRRRTRGLSPPHSGFHWPWEH